MADNLPELDDKLNNFYIPGDVIAEYVSLVELEKKLDLGFGLSTVEHYSESLVTVKVVVTHLGQLKFNRPNQIWIDSMTKVYIPHEGDRIVGKVVKKTGECFNIDFGGASTACLSYLHFQEATKNNRPNVNIGDIVYCQVSLAGRDFETELTCVNGLGKSAGMGVIDQCEDSVMKVDLPTARKLANVELFPLLKKLGYGILPHEIVVGANGWIWFATRSSREFVALRQCIELASHLGPQHIKDLLKTVRSGIFYSDNNNN